MRPVVDPFRVVVTVDGSSLPAADAACLSTVRVQQQISLPTMCELTFAEPIGTLRDGRSIKPGNSLKVVVSTHAEPLFDGEVTALEHSIGPSGSRQIRVRGFDKLHRLRKRQQIKTHDNLTPVELIKSLVESSGLEVKVDSRLPDGTSRPKVFQNRQTDFDLMAEQAHRAGIGFVVRGSDLMLLDSEGTGDAIDLTVGENLLECRVDCNGDSACKSVQTSAWNFARAEVHHGTADSARSGRGIAAEVLPEAFGVDGQRFIAGELVQDDIEATAVAQAELDRRAVGAVTMWGVADGDPLLRPGQPVNIHGVATPFDGIYAITSATHTVDGTLGFVTELSTAPPPRIVRSTAAVVTLGIVARVDDPDNLGRVQVTLPAYNDAQTDWVGVVTAGAGKGKGLVSLPDVADQVLVLCSQQDLAQGVVIGGLYGVNAPPDTGVDGTAVRRFSFVTPGGQRVRLDDGKNAVRIENSKGSFVELNPDLVTVHATADVVFEAPGHGIKIRGSRIDFEKADS